MPSGRCLRLEILTPDRRAFANDVESVVIPAADGLLGILCGHAPRVAMLKPGTISARLAEPPGATSPPDSTAGTFSFPVLSGFCRVLDDQVTVICRTAVPGS